MKDYKEMTNNQIRDCLIQLICLSENGSELKDRIVEELKLPSEGVSVTVIPTRNLRAKTYAAIYHLRGGVSMKNGDSVMVTVQGINGIVSI